MCACLDALALRRHECNAATQSWPRHRPAKLLYRDFSTQVSRVPLPAAVAKELTRRGFSQAWVVKGGFQGWGAAKLRTKPWGAAAAAALLDTAVPAKAAAPVS